ncbi:MAG: hypothetical protein ABIK09_12850 [Pseudomonadota bacterium]
MDRLTLLIIATALFLATPAFAQEEPLPSGPYDPQVEPEPEVEGPSTGGNRGVDAPPTEASEPGPKPEARIINIPKAKEPYFLSGARPIPLTDSALRIDLGFPDVRIAWHLPMSRTFEIAPAFGVAYGFNAENAGKMALLDFRCEIKWNFFRNEDIALALFADPGLQVPVWPDTGIGLIVGGPGLILDYAVIEKLHLTPAIQIPWGLYLMGKNLDFAARFPFLLRLGLEYQVSQTVNLLFHMSGGADVWTSQVSEGGAVSALLRMIFGVSIRL